MYLQIGTLLCGGKYRITRVIASGGFGCTYEVEHVLLQSRAAVKEFFPRDFCNRSADTSSVEIGVPTKRDLVLRLRGKFIEEARSMASLSHPGIVRVSDVFEENGTAYYVMDYIEGRSLLEIVTERGRVTEPEAVEYIRQVCDALKYVHSRNRLHLDIKPANIMIDGGSNRAILIDFGASKQYDADSGENHSALLGHTSGYAPIEQMDAKVMNFLPATDIYAVGATLYKLLTGETPPSSTYLASYGGMQDIPQWVSPHVSNAISAAMSTSKNNRPQTVDEFLSMLDKPEPKGNMTPQGTVQPPPVYTTYGWSDFLTDLGLSGSVRKTNTAPPPIPNNYVSCPEVPVAKTGLQWDAASNELRLDDRVYRMVIVSGGTKALGATPDQGSDKKYRVSFPMHSVTMHGFKMGQMQVPQWLWIAVMEENPSRFVGEELPVDSVSWEDCQQFLQRLYEITGTLFRLPTEAEWEYAARGEVLGDMTRYSGASDNLAEYAWYFGNSKGKTHIPGKKKPNKLHLYDMSGNVWEWCSDRLNAVIGTRSNKKKGDESEPQQLAVLRGGSWLSYARDCHVSDRLPVPVSCRQACFGLRLVL